MTHHQTTIRGFGPVVAVRKILSESSLAQSDLVKAYQVESTDTGDPEMIVNADRVEGEKLAAGILLDVIWSLSTHAHRIALNDLILLSAWDLHVVMDAIALRFGMTPACHIPLVPASSEVVDHTGRNRT